MSVKLWVTKYTYINEYKYKYMYDCPTINRSRLMNLPFTLDKLSTYEQLPTLLHNLSSFL